MILLIFEVENSRENQGGRRRENEFRFGTGNFEMRSGRPGRGVPQRAGYRGLGALRQ